MLQSPELKPGAHTVSPSMREAEAGGSLVSLFYRVPEQLELLEKPCFLGWGWGRRQEEQKKQN